MPTFEVMAPDGAKYRVTAPEGATEADAIAYVQQQHANTPAEPTAAPAAAKAPEANSDAFIRNVMSTSPLGVYTPDVFMGLRQPLDAAAQMAALGAEKLANKFAPESPIARQLSTMRQSTEDVNRRALEQYQSLFKPEERTGASLAVGAGNALATYPLLPTIKGAGLIKSLAQGTGIGAGMGVLQPVYEPGTDFVGQKLEQAKTGGEFGAAGTLGGRVLGRVISPAVNPKAQALQKEGVYVTPGQTGGAFAKAAEEKATSLPIVGDLIKSAQREGVATFNQALYARALRPLGSEAESYARTLPVGEKGIAGVGDYLSNAYDEALAKSVPNIADGAFTQKFVELANLVPRSKRGDFADSIKRIIADKITPAGTLTPSVAKDAESELGRLYRNYKGLPGDDQLLAQAYRQAQQNVRDLVARYNPVIAPRIAAINRGYATLTQLETAGARLGSKEGVVMPSAFLSAVKQSDKSIRDRAFARGEALNKEFANAADAVLSSKYPDSGTAGRMLFNLGTLGAGGLLAPKLLAGAAIGSIPYLPYIRNLVTSRPEALTQAGEEIRRLSPLLAIPASGLLRGL